MKPTKRLLIFCILHLICLQLSAQKGEMQSDSSSYFGIKIYNNGPKLNSQYCDYELAGERLKASPDSISSYTSTGNKYISRTIVLGNDSTNKFLELISEGNYKLYLYRDDSTKQFYIERDSTIFKALTNNKNEKASFKKDLEKYILMPQNSEALKYVRYNRYSLKTYFDAANSNSDQVFPHFQYGFTYAISILSFTNPDHFNEYLLKNQKRPNSLSHSLGLFISLPIMASNTYLRSEAQLTKQESKENYFNFDKDIDLISSVLWLDYQQIIRQTFHREQLQIYLEGGIALRYLLNNETQLYSSTIDGNNVYINTPYSPNIYSNSMVGYTAGTGISLPISKHEISFGFTFTQLLPHSDKRNYGSKSIALKSQFTF